MEKSLNFIMFTILSEQKNLLSGHLPLPPLLILFSYLEGNREQLSGYKCRLAVQPRGSSCTWAWAPSTQLQSRFSMWESLGVNNNAGGLEVCVCVCVCKVSAEKLPGIYQGWPQRRLLVMGDTEPDTLFLWKNLPFQLRVAGQGGQMSGSASSSTWEPRTCLKSALH